MTDSIDIFQSLNENGASLYGYGTESTLPPPFSSAPTTMVNDISWEIRFQDSSRFWVQRVLVPIVVIFGVLGNLITIYILTRRPMRSSTNVYLCALAVSDMFYLLFTFTLSLSHYNDLTQNSWIYWAYKPYGLWLTDAFSSTSVWLTVSFTIERYIAVCHPMRGKIFCTEERAMKAAVLVYLICFMVTLPTPFEWELVTKNSTDPLSNDTVYGLDYSEFGRDDTYVAVYYWFSSVVFVLLPIVLLGVMNTFLIRAVRQSRITRKAMANLQSSSARHIQAMRQENRITIILIAVVIVFLVCQLPTAIFLIYSVFHPPRDKHEAAFGRGLGGYFNLLVNVNAAVNFVLYTALSDKYRKYFCNFLLFWRKRNRWRRNGNGTTRGYTNPYEMDTINTSVSLSRGTSLRATAKHETTPRPSPYGLRRTQTCGTGNATRAHLVKNSEVAIYDKNISKDGNIPLIQVDQV